MLAIISDIHGNFPALQAVLSEIDKTGCDSVLSLGDVAGYYCMINECIDLLRQKEIINIMGNHDFYIINNETCPRSKSANDCLEYQRVHITEQNLDWLKNSQLRIDTDIASFVHGGWINNLDEYLTIFEEKYFKSEKASFFFSGHTHIQSLNILGRISHCNPGSVGQPRDKNPKAAFALFDGEKIFLKRVSYDIDIIAGAMDSCGFNSYYYKGLYTGSQIGV